MTYHDVNPFLQNDLWNKLRYEREQEILKHLISNNAFLASHGNNRYFIFSKSAKQDNYYQITYLDKNMIPTCDINRDDLNDIIEEIINIEYEIIERIWKTIKKNF